MGVTGSLRKDLEETIDGQDDESLQKLNDYGKPRYQDFLLRLNSSSKNQQKVMNFNCICEVVPLCLYLNEDDLIILKRFYHSENSYFTPSSLYKKLVRKQQISYSLRTLRRKLDKLIDKKILLKSTRDEYLNQDLDDKVFIYIINSAFPVDRDLISFISKTCPLLLNSFTYTIIAQIMVKNGITLKELSEKIIGISVQTVRQHLNRLCILKIITREKRGNKCYFYINHNHQLAEYFRVSERMLGAINFFKE